MQDFEIHSVKRTRDKRIFTIGDDIRSVPGGIIKRFKIHQTEHSTKIIVVLFYLNQSTECELEKI